MIVLSYIQVMPILAATPASDTTIATSLDLGLTTSVVHLSRSGVDLTDGQHLTWETLEAIRSNQTACFHVTDNEAHKIQFFSEQLDRVYTLMPTEGAPTMLISGIPMHRIKDIDPHQDTLRKVQTIAPVTGRVLDTATGLGYTAIEAARTAAEVVTIELDPTVLEVCRLNPWSQGLFNHDNIKQRIGDAYDEVATFEDGSFSRIIHDPPVFSLAGDLYGGEFYRQLYRVLKRSGRLFHYIGDPNSKSGHGVGRGVVRRLREAGFRRVQSRPRAFGVVAYK